MRFTLKVRFPAEAGNAALVMKPEDLAKAGPSVGAALKKWA